MNIPFNEHVKALAKPASAIMESLTPMKCHLLHMEVGVTGEYLEILQEESKGTGATGMMKEVGDILFYMQGICYTIMPDKADWMETVLIPMADDPESIIAYIQDDKDNREKTLLNGVEGVSVWIKRHVFYEKSDKDNPIAALFDHLTMIAMNLGMLSRQCGFTLEEAMAENQVKLADRYPEGAFSNEAANARADVDTK